MKKKVIDFYSKRKVFFGISIGIIVIGIICNVIFGASLDIQFSGGSMISYTYNGQIDENEMKALVQETTPEHQVSFSISKNIAGNNEAGDGYYFTIQFPGTSAIDAEVQSQISTALNNKYPDNNFEVSEFSSVDATMGGKFFVKCIAAVLLASVLMVIYVTIRFKKIGGMSAGMMGLVALLHDMFMVYFVFVIFRMPIDSNFIAVILMILGYSLNDTIVIYDRVRENKAKMGLEEMYNAYNQSTAVNWRWRKNGDVTSIPRAMYNTGYNWLGSDRYVEDASFIRMSYVQLSYRFNKKLLKAMGLRTLMLSLSAQNLLCFSKYSGTDPEHSAGAWGIAYDNSQTPRSKSVTLNINVGF